MVRRLKVLLIKPYQESNETIPPLGLGYLASTIRSEHEVEIFDGILFRLNTKKLRSLLKKRYYDVIGIQCYTSDLLTVKKYSDVIHAISPSILLLVGGPQPTSLPDYTLSFLNAIDFGFVGEAEIGFKKLIHLFSKIEDKNQLNINDLQSIPGLIYRLGDPSEECVIKTNPMELPQNLDSYDPSYDLFNLHLYPLEPHGAYCKQSPTAPIIVTRGCPNQCNFCGGYLISGTRIRRHSVKYIINLIKMLHNKYGIREIHIEDDNFTNSANYVREFCKELKALNYGITWTCTNGIRLDSITEELLLLMKESGMYSVSVGIEAGSERVRNLMNKNLSNRTIIEKMKIIEKVGIECIGFFILGYPGETEKEILQTIYMAKSLPLIRANFSIFKPFPGTKTFAQLRKSNLITSVRWNAFVLHTPVWADKSIGVAKLNRLKWKAILEFYMRPKIFFKIFLRVKNYANLKAVVFRILRIMFKSF